MIAANSRYRSAVIATSTSPDGVTRQEMRVPWPVARQVTFTYHRVVGGDRVDNLADTFYGNGALWWMIADANPEILDWMDLPVGQILRVPSA